MKYSQVMIHANCSVTMETTTSACSISQMITSPLAVPIATLSTGFEGCDFLYAQNKNKTTHNSHSIKCYNIQVYLHMLPIPFCPQTIDLSMLHTCNPSVEVIRAIYTCSRPKHVFYYCV